MCEVYNTKQNETGRPSKRLYNNTQESPLSKTDRVSLQQHSSSSRPSSSSSRNEYDLGGAIALLLKDHRTMSTTSVCNSHYMVTDQHWTTGEQIKHIVRSRQGTTTGTERSSVLGGRQEERTRSERVVVERSMPVRQPLRITDHGKSNDAWMVPVGLTSRRNGGVDMCHGYRLDKWSQ